MVNMIAALASADRPDGGWLLQTLADDGTPMAEPVRIGSVGELRTWEATAPRWLWDNTEAGYQALLTAGLRVSRCHDVTLTERILLGRADMHGEPASAVAVHARRHGLAVPADPPCGPDVQAAGLFEVQPRSAAPSLEILGEAYRDQLARSGGDLGLRLLVAAESAAGLAAVEMGHVGLPLRADVLDEVLTAALGPRPAAGDRPARLVALAAVIGQAFGEPVNPDSPQELRAAFGRAGIELPSTRSAVLRTVDHPAAGPLLAYKELSRLFSANGWNWLAEWVRDGRFHGGYLPGAVVSGRWAARGGGALQLPKLIRRAVIADPGHTFVVADAAQLEPRVLAAISGDPALAAVSRRTDLYAALASDGFGGDRAKAKVAMLGALYGATSVESGRLLATLNQRYPVAMAFVEGAARRGEVGGSVAAVLGRTSPTPRPQWWAQQQAGSLPDATPAQERRARQLARDRGRFTRNFVVQGSAADWAGVWLSGLRRDLQGIPGAELVLFQHDELVVHVPTHGAAQVGELAVAAAEAARAMVFPGSDISTPVRPKAVTCYADAK